MREAQARMGGERWGASGQAEGAALGHAWTYLRFELP